MADMAGRLTGRAGVCLGTLGPGALNLVTAVADADLDRAPLVALTGQRALEWMHKESHQVVDLVEVMRPITKWNARVADPEVIPEVVRKAFMRRRGREAGRDAPRAARGRHGRAAGRRAARATARRCSPSRRPASSSARPRSCAARRNPVVLAGNGVLRARAAPALREFARATGIGVAETFMGKGAIDFDDPLALGTVGVHDRDYELAGIADADVVIAVGYDLVEQAPEHWNPRRDKTIVVLDTVAAEIDAHFIAGGRARRQHRPRARAPRRGVPTARRARSRASSRLRDVVLAPPGVRPRRRPLPDAAAARAVGAAARARARRHPRLRRRAAQAVDRPDVRRA